MNYNRRDLSLFTLRLSLGLIFLIHGYQKLTGLEGTISFFSTIGVPIAGITAPLIGAVEFLGGLFLILGLLTRISSIIVIIDMIGAIIYVHGTKGFTGGGFEYPLLMITSAFAILSLGKGKISIQSFFTKN